MAMNGFVRTDFSIRPISRIRHPGSYSFEIGVLVRLLRLLSEVDMLPNDNAIRATRQRNNACLVASQAVVKMPPLRAA